MEGGHWRHGDPAGFIKASEYRNPDRALQVGGRVSVAEQRKRKGGERNTFPAFCTTCRPQKPKFSVQPFSKGWWGWKGQSPFLAFRRKRNPTRCASGATQKEGKAARRPPAVPAAVISQKLRHDALLIYPKRKTAPASRSVCTFLSLARFIVYALGAGLRPAGNPLIGFPFAQTSHRDVWAALPDLLVSFGGFRPLRRARRGAAPPPCQPFEKGWTENLFWVQPYCVLTGSLSRALRPTGGPGRPAP